MKYIFVTLKCIVLIVLSIILEVMFGCFTSLHMTKLICKMPYPATITLLLELVLIPTVFATLVIGLLGGIWVNKNAQIGFVIASLLSLIRLFVFLIAEPASVLLALWGTLPIIIAAGFTFRKIHSWRESKKTA